MSAVSQSSKQLQLFRNKACILLLDSEEKYLYYSWNIDNMNICKCIFKT